MGTVKTRFMVFKMDMRILKTICIILWQRTCLHFVYSLILLGAEFNGDGLINLVEEISRQHSI
jgi:hypothetical protein